MTFDSETKILGERVELSLLGFEASMEWWCMRSVRSAPFALDADGPAGLGGARRPCAPMCGNASKALQMA
jgi:hypothetical protein